MMRLLIMATASLFVFAGLSFGIDENLLAGANVQKLNEKAPAFSLKGEGGKTVSLDELRGKVVVLHFWATWCAPCREEFPLFNVLYENFKDKNVVFLPIAIDAKKSPEEIKAAAEALGARFPVYQAKNGNVPERYWTWGVPETYFIDKKGRIAGRCIGPRDWSSEQYKIVLNALLEER